MVPDKIPQMSDVSRRNKGGLDLAIKWISCTKEMQKRMSISERIFRKNLRQKTFDFLEIHMLKCKSK